MELGRAVKVDIEAGGAGVQLGARRRIVTCSIPSARMTPSAASTIPARLSAGLAGRSRRLRIGALLADCMLTP